MHRMCFTPISNLNLQRSRLLKIKIEPVRWTHTPDKRTIKKNTSSKSETKTAKQPLITNRLFKSPQASFTTSSPIDSSLKNVKAKQEGALKMKKKKATEKNPNGLMPPQGNIILVDWENVGPQAVKHFDDLSGEVVFFMGKETECAKIPQVDSWRTIETGNKEKNSADIMLVQFALERLLKGFNGRLFILTRDKGLQNVLTLLQPASSQIVLVTDQTNNYNDNTIPFEDLRSAHALPDPNSNNGYIKELTTDTMKHFSSPSKQSSILLLCDVQSKKFLTAFQKASVNIPSIHFVPYAAGKNFPKTPSLTNFRDIPTVPINQSEYIFTTMVKDLHVLARQGYLRQFQSIWVSTLNPLAAKENFGVIKSFSTEWAGWFTSNQLHVKVFETDVLLQELIKQMLLINL